MLKKTKYIFMSCLLLLSVFALYFYLNINKLVLTDIEMFSIVGGSIQNYTEKLTLTVKDNGTQLANNNKDFMLDSTPIYYKQEKKLLLPQNYAYVNFKSDIQLLKLNAFATIEQIDNEWHIKNGGYEGVQNNFFLFDGLDTYIFFYETKITYGEDNIIVSPMSFVTNIYNNKLIIYDFVNDKYNEIPVTNMNVQAVLSDSIKLDLNTDSLMSENRSQLLIKTIANLKNME